MGSYGVSNVWFLPENLAMSPAGATGDTVFTGYIRPATPARMSINPEAVTIYSKAVDSKYALFVFYTVERNLYAGTATLRADTVKIDGDGLSSTVVMPYYIGLSIDSIYVFFEDEVNSAATILPDYRPYRR